MCDTAEVERQMDDKWRKKIAEVLNAAIKLNQINPTQGRMVAERFGVELTHTYQVEVFSGDMEFLFSTEVEAEDEGEAYAYVHDNIRAVDCRVQAEFEYVGGERDVRFKYAYDDEDFHNTLSWFRDNLSIRVMDA